MENITAAHSEQTIIETTVVEEETKVETSLLQGNLLTRMRFDRASGSAQSKWVPGTLYRVSNRSARRITLKNDKMILLETIHANSAKTLSGERLQEISEDLLNGFIGANQITCRALEYKQDKSYVVSNLTAKRISIKHNYFSTGLFLPAFGSRTIAGKTLLEHDFNDWENQGLIKIESANEIEEDQRSYAMVGFLVIALSIFLLVSVPLAALFQAIRWSTIGLVAVAGLVLTVLSLTMAGRNLRGAFSNLIGWLKLLPGILLVLATGIGLPVIVVYLFGDGRSLIANERLSELGSLGRMMQVGFMAIASMLPAFLFYLFGRQQVETQKENFYREAMLLDPNVWSDSEAKNKYEPLLNSVFDTGNSPFSVLLLVISTSLLVMGWIMSLSPVGIVDQNSTNLIDFFTPVPTPFTFGFLGAYFFTINMIYRRYVRADLTTKTYAYITMRLLVTLVLVWTINTLPQFSASSALDTGLFIVAFIIGIFPETGLALIQDQFKMITKQKQEKESFSLNRLEGMNLYDRARLLEEGIENIENLAHHNLMELIARTRIPTPRLVDMFDQAILYLHLGLETENEDAETENSNRQDNPRKFLKSLGIRTATDLLKCQSALNAFCDNDTYKNLATRLGFVIRTLKDDEWFNYIQNWRSYSSSKEEPIDNPFKFHEVATKSVHG
jgi:hypothetical protein